MRSMKRAFALAALTAAALMGFASVAHAIVLKGPNGSVGTPVGIAPPPAYTGPTNDIAAVANKLTYQAKSVTTVVRAPAGISLERAVNISVGYGNGARMSQDYTPSKGNRIVYNFPEGDGMATTQSVWISLSQKDSAGITRTLSIPWSPTITPLYDVHLGALSFTLFTDCDTIPLTGVGVGDSEIRLGWADPANAYRETRFDLSAGEHHTVSQFASTWSEVAASSTLLVPDFVFYEEDPDIPIGTDFTPGWIRSSEPLVPGTTKVVHEAVEELSGQCSADVTYTQRYTLDQYPSL
jgi:hypothetical protein